MVLHLLNTHLFTGGNHWIVWCLLLYVVWNTTSVGYAPLAFAPWRILDKTKLLPCQEGLHSLQYFFHAAESMNNMTVCELTPSRKQAQFFFVANPIYIYTCVFPPNVLLSQIWEPITYIYILILIYIYIIIHPNRWYRLRLHHSVFHSQAAKLR